MYRRVAVRFVELWLVGTLSAPPRDSNDHL